MTIKQNNYKKILVLHGGFEAGDSALAHGLNLAKLSKGTVLPAGKTFPDGITTKAKYHPS